MQQIIQIILGGVLVTLGIAGPVHTTLTEWYQLFVMTSGIAVALLGILSLLKETDPQPNIERRLFTVLIEVRKLRLRMELKGHSLMGNLIRREIVEALNDIDHSIRDASEPILLATYRKIRNLHKTVETANSDRLDKQTRIDLLTALVRILKNMGPVRDPQSPEELAVFMRTGNLRPAPLQAVPKDTSEPPKSDTP